MNLYVMSNSSREFGCRHIFYRYLDVMSLDVMSCQVNMDAMSHNPKESGCHIGQVNLEFCHIVSVNLDIFSHSHVT